MRRDRLVVAGMIEACERIIELTTARDANGIDSDPNTRDALLWNFTVLGEGASQVSDQVRGLHPEVPWRRAAGTRNRIVHGYWSTDTDVLVTTAREAIPDLLIQLRALRAELPDEERC